MCLTYLEYKCLPGQRSNKLPEHHTLLHLRTRTQIALQPVQYCIVDTRPPEAAAAIFCNRFTACHRSTDRLRAKFAIRSARDQTYMVFYDLDTTTLR